MHLLNVKQVDNSTCNIIVFVVIFSSPLLLYALVATAVVPCQIIPHPLAQSASAPGSMCHYGTTADDSLSLRIVMITALAGSGKFPTAAQ